MLVDTHCHFNNSQFAGDISECLERAETAGVHQMLVVGYDLESSRAAVALAERENRLYAAVGVHPHDAKSWTDQAEAQIRGWADHPRVVAIGEIGLDYYRDLSPRPIQSDIFRKQMLMARECGLPVIIHCRDAYSDTLRILDDEGAEDTGGVMHCWAGSVDEAQQTVTLGLMLGFGGTLTYKGSDAIRQAAQTVPLETLLVETDAPYLSPMPLRGKRNEPAYTRIVAERLAELRELSLDDIARVTTANAHRCFPKMASLT